MEAEAKRCFSLSNQSSEAVLLSNQRSGADGYYQPQSHQAHLPEAVVMVPK